MKVALLGMFGFNNFGNEASLASAIRSMRRQMPGIDLFCICTRPRGVARDHAIDAVDLNLRALGDAKGIWRAILRCLRRAGLIRVVKGAQAYRRMRGVDALVIPGTGILDDFGLRPCGVPLDMLVWCAAASLRRAKIMFISVGAGPITNPRTLWLMRAAARMAVHRSFRDNASLEFMRSHGLDVSRDRVVPDIVFALHPESDSPECPRPADGLVVGIGVMNYRGWNADDAKQADAYRRHVEDTTEIVRGVLARGHSARLIVGEADDESVVVEVLKNVGHADGVQVERCIAPPLTSFHDLFRELRECDLVIGTRFHNVVCSLMLGVPVLSIGYADKNRDLLVEFGLGEYAHDIGTLNVARLMEQFDEVVERRLELGESIVCKARSYRAEANTYLNELWSTLGT